MSLTNRAVVAILLMIGFYVLALTVIAVLAWVPYAYWVDNERINRISVFCAIGAAVVLWSILPRFDRFKAPGPRITAAEQPRLFAEISNIAKSTGLEMPHDVYLIPDVNAWVAQRGGIMGLGSRRVMALGLPLMALMTVSQFRAVLTHEFGHYYGGDTKLGPWVYKTRAAILRTVSTLGRQRSYLAYLTYLFKWYAEMFLRITLAISRAQEYAADRLAAKLAGAKAMMDGLKQLHLGTAAWQTYLQTEVGPVLSAGFAPPLAQGLNHFLRAPQVEQPVQESLAKELAEGKADPFDSHPSLAERIAALREITGEVAEDTRPATDLLDNLQAVDTSLFHSSTDPLRPVAWDEALERVWAPSWQAQVNRQRQALEGVNVRDLGSRLKSPELSNRIKNLDLGEDRSNVLQAVASCALALALLKDGWTFHTLPGEAFCEKNSKRLEPFALIAQLAAGKISPTQWEELCAINVIGDLSL